MLLLISAIVLYSILTFNVFDVLKMKTRNVYFTVCFFYHLSFLSCLLFYHLSLWGKIQKKILYKSCFLDLEQIKIIYINSNGKNCFGFRTNRFSNSFLERIMFENRGLTVHLFFLALTSECYLKIKTCTIWLQFKPIQTPTRPILK